MTKGILIIAVGHPLYGNMAYNLALSIKAAGVKDPICIVHSGRALSHLIDKQKEMFDDFIPVPEGTDFRYHRTRLFDLSPFELTLALDADLIWMNKSTDDLWPILDKVPFTAQNFGCRYPDGTDCFWKDQYAYTWWGKYEDIKEHYDLVGPLYRCMNSFLLFRKVEETQLLFSHWTDIMESNKCATEEWNNGIADEFGLNIALSELDMKLHQDNWHPTSWDAKPSLKELSANYYALNYGGNIMNRRKKEQYDLLMQTKCYKMGVKHLFPLKSKREYLPHRIKQ
jgi:hypothetical protein